MTHISFTERRPNLSQHLDETLARRSDTSDGLIVAEAELAGWQETVYLLASQKNAERLLRGMRETEAGSMRVRAFLSPDAPSGN